MTPLPCTLFPVWTLCILVLIAGQLRATEIPDPSSRNLFGMHLRNLPSDSAGVRAPVIVREAPVNESSMLIRSDGTLELYFITKPESTSISVIRSKDSGFVWSEPVELFPLPGKAYYALQALEDRDGRVHVVFHIYGQGPGGYRGRLYEVYHVRQSADGLAWGEPQKILPGYVGAIRGFIRTTAGRLLVSVGKADPQRETAPAFGPDRGWNDVVTLFSDDDGVTWKPSPDVLNFPLDVEFPTRYGAIEPDLIELKDGSVWMLIRDRGGRFMESFSENGEHWSAPEKSRFITSDSPAEFLRLRNGSIVLFLNACQNWSNPKSYARGGREVLHAAVSSDDGQTWSGFREVLHEPPGAFRGDRGTAYASAAETREGTVALFAGQGEGKRFIVLFHPDWLLETSVLDDLSSGPLFWTQYGGEGLRTETPPGTQSAEVVLPLQPQKRSGAAWNFPAFPAGKISMEILIPEEVSSVSLSLTDHFSRMDDDQAGDHSIFRFVLQDLPGAVRGKWTGITLQWEPGEGTVLAGEELPVSIYAARASEHGVNYLRVEAVSSAGVELRIRNLAVER